MTQTADIIPSIPLGEQLADGDSPLSMALRAVTTVATAHDAVERQAAVESADRYIARQYPAVAALLADDAAREHPEVPAAGIDLDKVIAALPGAVDQAMRKTLPQHYSPELAATIAAGTARRLLTKPNVTLVHDYGFGAHRTTPIETEAREITDGSQPELPWLAAEVVVSDYRSQAYGRRTQVWLHNNRDIDELTVEQARGRSRAARAFLDRFDALVDYAETVAAGDFEGDPEVYAAEREAEDRRIAAVTAGRA